MTSSDVEREDGKEDKKEAANWLCRWAGGDWMGRGRRRGEDAEGEGGSHRVECGRKRGTNPLWKGWEKRKQ